MVSIVKKVKKGATYYYLRYHAVGLEKTRYLGRRIPDDIEARKREFELDMLRLQWRPALEDIRTGYARVPESQRIDNYEEFSYRFTHDTQKIEGSSLTKKETYELLRFNLTPAQKPESDMLEAKLHHQVFTDMARKPPPRLDMRRVMSWHKAIFEKTKPEIAGVLRRHAVLITGSDSRFPHHQFVPAFVRDFFKWLNSRDSSKAMSPVELAGAAHFRFVNIHPFGDGNGRTSRLLMNYILIKNRCPPLNIRFADRYQYYHVLEKGNLQYDEIHFLKWFVRYYMKRNGQYGNSARQDS